MNRRIVHTIMAIKFNQTPDFRLPNAPMIAPMIAKISTIQLRNPKNGIRHTKAAISASIPQIVDTTFIIFLQY